MTESAPFGTWTSPISADALVSGAASVTDAIPDQNNVYWSVSRPSEGGRTAIMCYRNGDICEITSAEANVRTTVHEYGGGSWSVADGTVYFVDYSDQRLRSIDPQGTTLILTPAPDASHSLRFADFAVTADRHWIIAVCERHAIDQSEAVNTLVAIPANGSMKLITLSEGADFYSSPRLSPANDRLAWIEWNHPNMPWDDTLLRCAELREDEQSIALGSSVSIAGGPGEAVVQPEFSPDGVLHFLSDREDFWYLYKEDQEQAVIRVNGEIGTPPWVFGQSRYAFKTDGSVIYARTEGGIDYLDGFPEFSSFRSIRCSQNAEVFIASSWQSEAVVVLNGGVISAARDLAADWQIKPAYLQAAESLTFDTDAGEQAHALYFPPANPEFNGSEDQKPPLIVLAHGGPTSSARSELNLARQFWTSRGFAIADVNYRGSSGFGRRYRQKLNLQWGIADVADCVNVARFLAQRGDVDPQRLIIRGGSAGGFTVLSALAFHDVFTAGANMYGVADLEALAQDTHKFESRYLDNLVGPYPQERERYRERSPIHHLDGFTAPMIVLQGSEDAIVPPNQSRMIVDALVKREVPVAYLEFAGEQHGFRQAETIKTALESELAFYGRVFGFNPANCEIEVDIKNLAG